MEREARCKVSAFEVPLPDSDSPEYALVVISDAATIYRMATIVSLSVAGRYLFSATTGHGLFW